MLINFVHQINAINHTAKLVLYVQMYHGGALVVVPIKDSKDRVFGVLAVDTVNDPRNRLQEPPAVFNPTDTDFYRVQFCGIVFTKIHFLRPPPVKVKDTICNPVVMSVSLYLECMGKEPIGCTG